MLVNKKTIIFITVYPFNEDYGLKYGFDVLIKRGFRLLILNVSDFLYPRLSGNKTGYYEELNPVMGIEQINIRSGNELKNYLLNLNSWKIAYLVAYPFISLRKVLTSAKTDYIMTNAGHHPLPHENMEKRTFIDRLSRLIKRFIKKPDRSFLIYLCDALKFYIYNLSLRYPMLFGIKYPRYYIRGTEGYIHPFSASKTNVIRAHSFDYDRYLRNRDRPKPKYIPNEKYYVHIADTPWGGHDYIFMNYEGGITKSEYRDIINSFFDLVENRTGGRIVIAAHPKHTDEDNIYNGRPFLSDTEQLIKYSSGVICHFSGAARFAVIHKKPLCFISLWKMKDDKHFQSSVKAYAKAVESDIYYIDRREDAEALTEKGFFSYNHKSYENYMKKYIKPYDSSGRLIWDIVADRLCAENF